MAIDVQELIDTLCQGYAQPCHGPVPPMLWACHGNLAPLPFDPDSARAALAEEGWLDHNGDGWLDRDGKEFEFELKTNLGNELRVAAAPMIQAQLEEIGVRVIPRSYEWNGLWDSILDRAYEGAVLLGWSVGWKADLKPLFHSESHAGYNHTGYSNPILDLLIDRALAMETLEEAKPLWQEAQAQIVADQPYTFLFITDKIFGVNKRVRGTLPDPRSFYRNLEDWWVPVGQQHSGAPT
jgi:peptide/nickel transport system substrate-binding protein